MAVLLLLGLALGLDSLRASCALGAIGVGRRRQYQLALSFGLADGISPLIGTYLGATAVVVGGPWSAPMTRLLLAGCALHVIWASRYWAGGDLEDSGLLFGLPVAFSLDNLVAGVGLAMAGQQPMVTAVVLGVSSAAMSLVGFRVGEMTVSRLRPNLSWLAGVTMLVIALGLELRPP